MTTTLSIIALFLSAGALAVSWVFGLRSAKASEKSARYAEKSAKSAAEVAHAELTRDHEMFQPRGPANPGFIHVPNERTNEDDLFFEFTPRHGFRMAGDSVSKAGNTESRSPLALSPIAEAGKPVRIFVGSLNGRQQLPEQLHLRFWPTVAGDPGDSWTCPCGRNTDPSGTPHWEWNEPVPQDANYSIRDSLG